jgi:hypothetical protein
VPIPLAQTSTPASGNGTSRQTNFAAAVTAGDGIVAAVASAGAFPTSVVDSEGATLALVDSNAYFGNHQVAIYFRGGVSAGGSGYWVKANFAAAQSCAIVAWEVGGAIVVNAHNSKFGNSTTPDPGPVTTTDPNTIVFVLLGSTAAVIGPPAGFTASYNDSSLVGSQASYQIFTTTQTALDPTWAVGPSSQPYAATIVAIALAVPDAAQGMTAGFALGAIVDTENIVAGIGLGASVTNPDSFDYTVQGFALGASFTYEGQFDVNVTQGFALGAMMVADLDVPAGFALGAIFASVELFASMTAGFALGSRATGTTGALATGRYRR